MFKKIDPKKRLPQVEQEILEYWNSKDIFKKTLQNRKGAKSYSFYDGPPFATGTPHYGHIVASTMKDVVPRYWTMRGYYVERKWGWDCHGLPIENIVEKELGSQAKKDIEKLGVAKFNQMCRSKVLEYVEEWKRVISRLGRWADMENAYKTMDLPYMESVWWVFKQLWDKDLIFEGYRSMHVCPRCETTLSQSEVSEGYKDVKDLSAIAKFELLDEPGTYILAWTTTPWTLIGNVALAVGADIDYVVVEEENEKSERFVFAKDLAEKIMGERQYKVIREVKGSELEGLTYNPLFDYYAKSDIENKENGWKVYVGDFVNTDEGTGIVHIAPAFGEDDMQIGKKYDLPFIQHVGMDGFIKSEAGDFAGMHVKPADDLMKTDIEIIRYLAHNGTLFHKEKYEHSYPHCWRCDSPLINYATSSWFVDVPKIKEKALETAKEISWIPSHMKEGRFGNWLEGAREWSISRQRFWASVMPIWKCECGEMQVFGSVKELEDASGVTITDIHKHVVDDVTVPCPKCEKQMKRIPDVLDTWFDSGSMPYAQKHYPFENKEKFEKSFPAQFIAEGVDQTRAWFYYLHVISNGIKETHAFENVIVNGIVQAEDGKKMSKRLKNYPDPYEMFEKYGADVIRFYLMSSPVVHAQNINFSEKEVSEFSRGMFRMLWNSYSFFVLYAGIDKWEENVSKGDSPHFLDRWIFSELNMLIREVNETMEKYDLAKTARLFPKFIDNLSNWYIRRSRKRFWKSENDEDKYYAYATLYEVLATLSKLMAPFTPFISEEIYRNLTDEESVHLTDFPVHGDKLIDENINEKMSEIRELVSKGLQLRAQSKVKVRQPLSSATVKNNYEEEFIEIIKEELNVKEIIVNPELKEDEIEINLEITKDLKLEGQARELVRHIQEMRKEAGYDVDNRINICYNGLDEVFNKFNDLIAHEILADKLSNVNCDEFDLEKEFMIDGERTFIQITRA